MFEIPREGDFNSSEGRIESVLKTILQIGQMNESLIIGSMTVLGAALSGCATSPVELMRAPPDMVHISEKSPHLVARCIDSKWEDTRVLWGSNYVDSKQIDAGIRVTQRVGGDLHFVALVVEQDIGSQTQLWTYKTIGRLKQLDDVKRCQ